VSTAAGAELRVLTLNVLFRGDVRARITALGRLLAGCRVDVVCLQELVSGRMLGRLDFPHRTWGGIGPWVRGGLVVLSRHPVAASRFEPFTLTGAPRPSLGDALLRKGRLRTRIGGATVIDTHLQSNPSGDWVRPNRWNRRQEFELGELARTVAAVPGTEPLIVAGDFNVPPDFPPYRRFLRETGLHDPLAPNPPPTFRGSRAAIDHILVRGAAAEANLAFEHEQVRTRRGRVLPLSDHIGIVADVRLS
jgi:endonuclease/exonuclease/phosphatase family metal-dependent hydrolase